jgi:hypothetical protein
VTVGKDPLDAFDVDGQGQFAHETMKVYSTPAR